MYASPRPVALNRNGLLLLLHSALPPIIGSSPKPRGRDVSNALPRPVDL